MTTCLLQLHPQYMYTVTKYLDTCLLYIQVYIHKLPVALIGEHVHCTETYVCTAGRVWGTRYGTNYPKLAFHKVLKSQVTVCLFKS